MARRLPPSPLTSFLFVTIVAYLMIAAFVLLIDRVGGDPGVGWHLKSGEIIFTSGKILTTDPFLFGSESKPWICNQWLSDLILFVVYHYFSWLGLHIFCFVVGFGAYFFIFARSVLDPKRWIVSQNIAFALAILCGSLHWISRPVVFSLLGFAVTDALIRSHRNRKLSNFLFITWLVPLFALWANLHPAFTLGLALLGLYAVSAAWDCALKFFDSGVCWVALAVAIGASGLNPFGFELHRSAIELGRSHFFMNLNTEWQPPTPQGAQFWPMYIALILGLYGSFKVKGSSFDSLKAIVFSVLALKAGRFIPFFGIAAFPGISSAIEVLVKSLNLDRFFSTPLPQLLPLPPHSPALTLPEKSSTASLNLIPVALFGMLAVLVVIPPSEAVLDLSPHQPIEGIHAAFAGVTATGHPPVFHTPDWGGAIIWSTYPKRLAWIDDRNEFNGEQKYRDFLAIDNLAPDWKTKFEKWGFTRVLTRPTTPLATHLSELADGTRPAWRKIFSDKQAVVFEKVSQVDSSQP